MFLLIELEDFPKKPASNMHVTLARLFNCVCIAHVL